MLQSLIVVDRETHQLDLYRWNPITRRYKRSASYEVTVGKQGARTPHGLYFVQGKSRTPDWQVPPSPDYPREIWGKIYKFGSPGCPFAGGFISLAGKVQGVGIHGTSFDPQVGTDSSHGCVRMRTEDVKKLYDKCKVGTPVYLH